MKKIINSRNLVFLTIMLFTVFVTLNGCKKDDSDPNVPANEVWMENSAYSPSTLSIDVNTTVTWINKDGTDHTVTSNTGLFDSGDLNNDDTFTHQFTATGTYPYHCTFHPMMTATIIVK